MENLFEKYKPLTTQQAIEYQKKYGKNKIITKKENKFLKYFFESLKNTMLIVLFFAGVIAFFLNDIIDAIVILIVVFINIFISIYQEYRADNSIKKIQSLIEPFATVIRDDKLQQIKVEDIVVYDHVILNTGDKIPADGILIKSEGIFVVDESMLSGESLSILKDPTNDIENYNSNNYLYAGTIVNKGKGTMLVLKIGNDTKFGHIAFLSTVSVDDESPLQKEMFYISKIILYVVFLISLFFFFYGIYTQKTLVDSLIFAIAVAVATIPEGLITAITITLLIGIERLSQKKAVVKKISAAETLGCITTICSDKTGTITKNEMTVTNIWTVKNKYFLSQNKYINEISKDFDNKNDINLDMICKISALCNESFFDYGNAKYVGDPTEISLHIMNKLLDFNESRYKNFEIIKMFEFDSHRKMMSVVVKDKFTNKLFLFVKGSLNSIIKKTTKILNQNEIRLLNDDDRFIINKQHDEYANKALRILGFAYKEINDEKIDFESISTDDIEKDLIYVGMVGMIDPQKEGVEEAIFKAKKAGIRVIMITGDNKITAIAIAKNIGMINENEKYVVIDGDEISDISIDKLQFILNNKLPIIFSRTSPEQKYNIIEALQKNGEIVCVTGDGINDAPALKNADIGIAMGSGSDVSKEVSDMVLLDNNFATIINAIEGGRHIYQNIKKMVYYLFATNISELFLIIFAVIINIPIPLNALQILFINIVDVIPSISLSTDKSKLNVLNMPPRDPKSKIMSFKFNLGLIIVGLTISLLSFIVYLYYLDKSYIYASTMAFLTIIVMQLYHIYNCKNINQSIFNGNILSNILINLSVIITLLIVFIIMYVPSLQEIFKLISINIFDLFIVMFLSLVIFFVEEIRKKYLSI